MKNFIFTSLLATLCVISAFAQKQIVWENPTMGYSRFERFVTFTKVEFDKDKTIVSMNFNFPPGVNFGFTNDTKLISDGKEYAIQSMTGLELNKMFKVPEGGNAIEVSLTFEPLPMSTSSFDFVIGNSFLNFANVHNRQSQVGLTGTNWRDEQTGDWIIGFSDDKIVYDCKVWDVIQKKEHKDSYTIVAKCGDNSLNVSVGKEKKGKRTVVVNNESIVCDKIVTAYLPDYPVPDSNLNIADNHFKTGDSVTIVGWFKDMPKEVANISNEFSVGVRRIFARLGDDKIYSVKMTPEGLFSLRFPVENSMMLFVDWERSTLNMFVEPNETYFLLKDFANSQVLVMGKAARINNEILNSKSFMNVGSVHHTDVQKVGGIMSFLTKNDSIKNVNLKRLGEYCDKHPNISQRFKTFGEQIIMGEVATQLMQARFSVENNTLPEEYVGFVTENYWNRLLQPYSMTVPNTFIRDYIDGIDRLIQGTSFQVDTKEWLKELLENRKSNLTDKEYEIIGKYIEDEEFTGEFSAVYNGDKVRAYFFDRMWGHEFNARLDSLKAKGWNAIQRDIYITYQMVKMIENERKALSESQLNVLDTQIQTPGLRDMILEMHNKYVAIHNKNIEHDVFKSNDDLKDMSEGEQILRKILEPYKGKLVLIDIWGTWCTPCKKALSHSKEEYERLKPYDMVFLYLANRSPDDTWKNVIKEYDVQGDNVVHYNLPGKQQSAIEHFLGVGSFPTYKLVDRDGAILDVNADPRNLKSFEALVKLVLKK